MATELPFATLGEPQATDSPAAAIAARLRREAATAANLSPHSFSTLRFATEDRTCETEAHTPPALGMNQPGGVCTTPASRSTSRTIDMAGAAELTPGRPNVTVVAADAESVPAHVSFGKTPTAFLSKLHRHATNSDAATLIIGQNTRPENNKL